jgi:type IV secretory pathway VirJ component
MTSRPATSRPRSKGRLVGRTLAILLALLVVSGGIVCALAGFFDRDPAHFFAARNPRGTYVALYLSGDMGLRFGMGPYATEALSTRGIPVYGLNSPTAFATRQTRAQLDAIVTKAAREALAKTGATKLILIGQSFGADILQTGLANFPESLREQVAAVILVVPGQAVYFQADPTSIHYQGTPDSLGSTTAARIDWVPLTCIYGAQEDDSLCPSLKQHNATVIRLPGGHFLRNDHVLLIRMMLAAIGSAAPGSIQRHR